MEAHQRPGQLVLLAREMTPARFTLTEKVRDDRGMIPTDLVSPEILDHAVIVPFFLTGLSPRNSLEVLTPEIPGERDRGNCITSLQLHPKGWATLIRCSSNMDDQEVRSM